MWQPAAMAVGVASIATAPAAAADPFQQNCIGFNHRRLHEYCGDIPPVDPEAGLLRSTPETTPRLTSQIRKSPDSSGGFRIVLISLS
jgi:hypothetical protein